MKQHAVGYGQGGVVVVELDVGGYGCVMGGDDGEVYPQAYSSCDD